MPQPTNAELLTAINGLESRLNERIDKQDAVLGQIVETLSMIQESEHQRGLELAQRVERLEQGAAP